MFPTQITLRNLPSSPGLSIRVRDLCEKLGHIHPRILNCRVAIEQASEGRPRTRLVIAPPFSVEVRLRIPSSEIVTPQQEAEELDAALRMAFATIRRQLRAAIVEERPTIAG